MDENITPGASTSGAAGHDGNDLTPLVKLTTLIYALQALGFLLAITFVVAIVINHIKDSDVTGTWLASHFTWQIRTFWWGLLWAVIGGITTLIVIGFAILFADFVWVIYRIAKGWLRLYERKAMYV